MDALMTVPPAAAACTVRRLRPADAAGVVGLIRAIYGDSYYPLDFYDPEAIVRRNDLGTLVSAVAVDPAERVVGHYALERPDLCAVAEASDAAVLPDYRHHHLMEEMRRLLRGCGAALGLAGLVGYPVTNHTFSQDAEERFGAHPCGLALGLWPRSFHNLPEPLPQRMSFVIYFWFLARPASAVHRHSRHADLLARICRQFDRPVDLRDDEPARGAGAVSVIYEPPVATGTIRVRRIGADTTAAVRRGCADLCSGSGARTLTLEIPLAQPGAAELCHAAEEDGFFFSGLGPAFADDGDALLLQLPREDLDPSLLRVDHPFAKDLLAYVDGERTRVWKPCSRWRL